MSEPNDSGDNERTYWTIIVGVTVAAVVGVGAYFLWFRRPSDADDKKGASKSKDEAAASSTTTVATSSRSTTTDTVSLSSADLQLFPWKMEVSAR